jgi:excisionase family DNA binding protein
MVSHSSGLVSSESAQRGTMSLTEAAQRLGLSVKATRKAAKAGEIPAIQIGRRLLVLRDPLESMLRTAATPKHKAPQNRRGGRPAVAGTRKRGRD